MTDSGRESRWDEEAVQVIAKNAANLSIIEMAIGAVVHTLHLPLGGHLLSLNQALYMSRAVSALRNRSHSFVYPLYVANIAAVLKSLSPSGGKLGPMISISCQGALFALGVLVGGPTVIGVMIGCALLSLWAFVQPVLTLYLFFGKDLFKALMFYLHKLHESLHVSAEQVGRLVMALVLIKLFLALVVAWLGFHGRLRRWELSFSGWAETLNGHRWQRAEAMKAPLSCRSRVRAALGDVFRPLFLASLALMVGFFWFSETEWARTIVQVLRAVASAFIIFYLSRSPRLTKVALFLRRYHRFARFMTVFDKTTARLRPGSSQLH